MEKRQIRRINKIDAYWWVIRFTGPRVPFLRLLQSLRSEHTRRAYWLASAFEGRGGWCREHGTLFIYGHYFDNLEIRMGVAERRYEGMNERMKGVVG